MPKDLLHQGPSGETTQHEATYVANSQLDPKWLQIVGDMFVDLTHPIFHVVGQFLVRDIIDHDDVLCVPVRLSTYTRILD